MAEKKGTLDYARFGAHGRVGELAVAGAASINKALVAMREAEQVPGTPNRSIEAGGEMLMALIADIDGARVEEIGRLSEQVATDKANWTKARQENAGTRSPVVADEQRRIGAMSTEELDQAAFDYEVSGEHGDIDTLQIMANRLRTESPAIYGDLRKVMADRRAEQPWTHGSEAYDDLEHLQTISGRGVYPLVVDGARAGETVAELVEGI